MPWSCTWQNDMHTEGRGEPRGEPRDSLHWVDKTKQRTHCFATSYNKTHFFGASNTQTSWFLVSDWQDKTTYKQTFVFPILGFSTKKIHTSRSRQSYRMQVFSMFRLCECCLLPSFALPVDIDLACSACHSRPVNSSVNPSAFVVCIHL